MKYIKKLLHVFGNTDDILVIGYHNNGADHNETIRKVLEIYQEENLKLDKQKCHSGALAYHSLETLYWIFIF